MLPRNSLRVAQNPYIPTRSRLPISRTIVSALFPAPLIPRPGSEVHENYTYLPRKRLARLSRVETDFRCGNDPRCDKATEIGVTRLATVRCPTGLAFDIERQTCDWKTNVKNCDQLESKRHYAFFPP